MHIWQWTVEHRETENFCLAMEGPIHPRSHSIQQYSEYHCILQRVVLISKNRPTQGFKGSQNTSYPILDLHLYISTSFNDWSQASKVALVTSLMASSPMKSGCMSVPLLTSNFVFKMFTVSSHSETTSSTVSAVHQLEVKDETSEPSTEDKVYMLYKCSGKLVGEGTRRPSYPRWSSLA